MSATRAWLCGCLMGLMIAAALIAAWRWSESHSPWGLLVSPFASCQRVVINGLDYRRTILTCTETREAVKPWL